MTESSSPVERSHLSRRRKDNKVNRGLGDMSDYEVPESHLWGYYRGYLLENPIKFHKDALKATLSYALGRHRYVEPSPISPAQENKYYQLIDSFKDRPM